MKFSKQLSAQADLRYLSQYISYKDLKKAIKVITGSDVQVCTVQDVVSNFGQTNALTGALFRPPESRFQDLLNHELDKINSFSRDEVSAILDRLRAAQATMRRLHAALTLLSLSPDSPAYAEAQARMQHLAQKERECTATAAERAEGIRGREGDSKLLVPREESGEFGASCQESRLTRDGNGPALASGSDAQTEGVERRGHSGVDAGEALRGNDAKSAGAPEELIRLQKELLEVEGVLEAQSHEIVFLDSFVRLNFTGFRKITKKYDKHNRSSAASWYMSRVVRQDFMNLNFTLLLTNLASGYASLRSLRRLFAEQQHSFSVRTPAGASQPEAAASRGRDPEGGTGRSKPDTQRATEPDSSWGVSGAQRGEGAGDGATSRFYSPAGGSLPGDGAGDLGARANSTKYLVPPDELVKVKVMTAKHLSLLAAGGVPVSGSVSSPFAGDDSAAAGEKALRGKEQAWQVIGGGRTPTWDVYLDNEEFTFYTATRMQGTAAAGADPLGGTCRLVRVRWQGAPSLNSAGRLVALELSRPDESAADPQEDITRPLTSNAPGLLASPYVVILRHTQLQQLLHGQVGPAQLVDELAAEMESAAGAGDAETAAPKERSTARGADEAAAGAVSSLAKEKRKEQMLHVLQTVWDAVTKYRVAPGMRTWFYRTAFKSEDGAVWIALDEDIRFSREMKQTPPANQWIRSETDALSTDDVYPFPWGVLDVSVRVPSSADSAGPPQQEATLGRAELDEFAADLRGLETVTEVRGFSLFAHGAAYLYTPQLQQLQAAMSGSRGAGSSGSASRPRGVDLIPHWLQYTSSAEFDEDRAPGLEEADGRRAKAGDSTVEQERQARSQGDSGGDRGRSAGGAGGLSGSAASHRGRAIDVVLKGTSASLVHELQASAQVSPPASSGFDQYGCSYRPPPSGCGRQSSTSSLLADAPSLPLPAPPVLEGSPLCRGPAPGLLSQPLLDDGGAGVSGGGHGAASRRGGAGLLPSSWLRTCARYWRRCCRCVSSSGSSGGRHRWTFCLCPWASRGLSARRVHPAGPGALAAGGATSGASVRVEPKTFFANERTLLQWMNTAVLIATISITLMNFGNPVGRVAGLLMSPVAVFFIGYSFWVYLRRARALERKEPIDYNDKLGPSILVVTLMVSLSAVILLNLLYPRGDEPVPEAVPIPASSADASSSLLISPSSLLPSGARRPHFSHAGEEDPASSLEAKHPVGGQVATPALDVTPSRPAAASAAAAALAALQAASSVADATGVFGGAPEAAVRAHARAAEAHAVAARAAASAAAEAARIAEEATRALEGGKGEKRGAASSLSRRRTRSGKQESESKATPSARHGDGVGYHHEANADDRDMRGGEA
ncbi:vacuolar transporter chaperone VTC2 [Besnoitia besnoiti]|uniref:Vacuolar transporter chaperone VTC2 n=1 Tax=Besnoitia besnoiti TaxID=94643 RepID=A0A2A9MHQ4_BESBE|nr:vacuolar transporter chaperone VTC2 [Besnoitia besnoiti]PFH34940.1 vacuolar transporter chaperone VTC2 [Besnoitia besnoiti]